MAAYSAVQRSISHSGRGPNAPVIPRVSPHLICKNPFNLFSTLVMESPVLSAHSAARSTSRRRSARRTFPTPMMEASHLRHTRHTRLRRAKPTLLLQQSIQRTRRTIRNVLLHFGVKITPRSAIRACGTPSCRHLSFAACSSGRGGGGE